MHTLSTSCMTTGASINIDDSVKSKATGTAK